MAESNTSNRFARSKQGRPPTIDDVLKDCQDLQDQVDSLQKELKEIKQALGV